MAAAIHAFPYAIEEEQPDYDAEPVKREIGFGIVDAQVRALKNGYATAVYEVLAAHANPDGVSWPPLTTICEMVGWSKPTVIKAIKALTDAGLVTVEQQRHHGYVIGNRYTLPLRKRTKSTTFTQSPSIIAKAVNDIDSGGKGDLPRQSTSLTQAVNDVDSSGKPRLHKQDVVKQDSKKQESDDDSPKPFDLLAILCEEQGQDAAVLPKSEKNKQLGMAKRLIADDNLTADETRELVRHLLGQKWVTNGVDFSLIENQLGKWRLGTGVRSTGNRKIFHSPKITDYKPEEWHILAYAKASTPEELELSRQAAERVMG